MMLSSIQPPPPPFGRPNHKIPNEPISPPNPNQTQPLTPSGSEPVSQPNPRPVPGPQIDLGCKSSVQWRFARTSCSGRRVRAMDCPQCHTPNPEGTGICVKCSPPIDWQNSTLPIPSPDPAATMALETQTTAWSQPATVLGDLPPPAALQPGAVPGEPYQIVKLPSEGGLGAVYRAHDRELDSVMALKVIR